jgi:hypothetical protein
VAPKREVEGHESPSTLLNRLRRPQNKLVVSKLCSPFAQSRIPYAVNAHSQQNTNPVEQGLRELDKNHFPDSLFFTVPRPPPQDSLVVPVENTAGGSPWKRFAFS